MEKNEKIEVFTKIMDIQTKIRTYSKIFNTYSIEIAESAITEIDKYEKRNEMSDFLATFSMNFSDIGETLQKVLNELEDTQNYIKEQKEVKQ